MALMGIDETTATGQDVIAAMVQAELRAKAKLIFTISDYTNLVEVGAKSVSFPYGDSLTAQDKVQNTPTTAQVITYGVDQMVLDKYKHCYTVLEDRAKVQSKIDVEADIAARHASAIVDAIETSINTALLLASSSSPDHQIDSDGYTLALADLTEAISLLDAYDVPDTDRFIAINPKQKRELLDIDGVIQADKFGSPVTQNGVIAQLFGIPVVMSTKVTADKVIVYHKSHVAFAAQMAMNFEKMRDLANLADEYSTSMLYGTKVLDSGHRAVVITVR